MEALHQKLRDHRQEHVLRWWEHLTEPQRQEFLRHLEGIDLPELAALYKMKDEKYELPSRERIAPLPWPEEKTSPLARKLAEDAVRAGQLAYLVVAGGQGTRLGFDHPKGMYQIGPISNKSLFQIHVEKVLALARKYKVSIPFLLMTSPATHDETVAYFREQKNFGLPADDVWFFQQKTMPALDLATGRLLLEDKHRLFQSPNGHGGTLTGLSDSGLLDRLGQRGVETIYYFQVDNPLIHLADLEFLGRHLEARAEVSCKVIAKEQPKDKVGNFVLIDGKCSMIEYSDLPDDLAHERDEQGRLKLWAGNPAIHLFDRKFLARMTRGEKAIPWHVARKKVPYLDEHGAWIEPKTENALKFERFIFDVLPEAERLAVMITPRAKEFEPLKNATGADSPASVRRALSNLAGAWLEQAGVKVPRDADGHVAVPLEISPLFALDSEELAEKVSRDVRIEGPTYFQ